MTVRSATLVAVALLMGRPALGQRLADLPPIYIAHAYSAPSPLPIQCSVVTHAMWGVAGAIVGAMGSVLVMGLAAWNWDSGPSAAHRREIAWVVSAGALGGGIYGWFVLADRYSCG